MFQSKACVALTHHECRGMMRILQGAFPAAGGGLRVRRTHTGTCVAADRSSAAGGTPLPTLMSFRISPSRRRASRRAACAARPLEESTAAELPGSAGARGAGMPRRRHVAHAGHPAHRPVAVRRRRDARARPAPSTADTIRRRCGRPWRIFPAAPPNGRWSPAQEANLRRAAAPGASQQRPQRVRRRACLELPTSGEGG
jgi:hypothetical protein